MEADIDRIKLLHKERDEVRFILTRFLNQYSDECYKTDRMYGALMICHDILTRMVEASESGFAQYANHHEPLRRMAAKAIPIVNRALDWEEK